MKTSEITQLSRLYSLAAIVAVSTALSAYAARTEILELSLATDTNAVIDVAEGDVTVIDKVSGNRGTITKTGDGVLEVRLMRNSKARFDIQGGRLYFGRQEPRVCEDAFFHVDASRADTLELEEENGTNFVVRWNDVRGNGNYATNSLWSPAWRPNPEKRRAFISSVTQNGLPVVDFGPMLFNGLTNAVGEIQGYGATMSWRYASTNTYEIYEVISDTPDVATIPVDYPRFKDTSVHAVSFISHSRHRAGNYREKLGSSSYPAVFYDNSNNNGWMHGRVYLDGSATNPNSSGKYGKFSAGAGFHLMGFTTREYNAANNWTDYCVGVNSFARDYEYSCGAQRLGEYLVFTNRLTAADRSLLQSYLMEKWKGTIPEYIISSLAVADGASVEFAPGVSVKVANVSEGSDLVIGNGSMALNPLNNPDAFFHVDASDSSTLVLEEMNGTNFVRRWDDALGNGMYATNYFGTSYTYRSDPENRFPFISAETLNGRPVVDFGSLLVPAYTNETGYGLGYGGCLKWSSQLTANAREVFTVTRDTEDVKTLYSVPGIGNSFYGQAYICDPSGMHGFRYQLVPNNYYPPICVDHSNNNAIKLGVILVDGISRGFKTWYPTEGFHVFNFQLAAATLQPNWFACSKPKAGNNDRYSWGGTRIAEYLVFPNALSNDVRTAIYSALRTKWFGATNAVATLRNLAVAPGAALSIKWRDLVVSDKLSMGGTLSVDDVKVAGLALTAADAQVEGSLTVGADATVTANLLGDGTVGSLSASNLTLSGGGTVVFDAGALRRLHAGELPIMTTTGTFAGSLDGWTVDDSSLPAASVKLQLKEDGVYALVVPKGTAVIVR